MKSPRVCLSRSTLLAGCIVLGIVMPAAAQSDLQSSEPGVEQRTILSTGTTATNEPIQYPLGGHARVTIMEITLQPGQETGWHAHPVPIVGYIRAGGLSVDYGAQGQRTYHKGDAIVEALNEPHNGRSTGPEPLKILAVIVGVEGVAGSVAVSPPFRPLR